MGVDFIIVVVGVFVGLQVQEWSAARAERTAEHAAIERLIDEYQQNLELLGESKEKSQTTMAGTERLLTMISPDPGPIILDEALAQTLMDCLTNAVFIPAIGTANSLVASGDLGLIDYLAWPDIDRLIGGYERTSALESDFQGLFSSKRFEGLLHNRWYNTGASIDRIEELVEDTKMLIDRLESRRSTLEAP